MTEEIQPLNWKDRLVAIIILIIGIIFLAMQVVSILSSRADSYTVENQSIVMNRAEFLNDVRIYLTIILGIAGGTLMLMKKTLGWILSFPVTLLFLVLSSWGIYTASKMGEHISIALALASTSIMLLCFLHLLMPATRKKYRASRKVYLPTLVFLAILAALYFYLQ